MILKSTNNDLNTLAAHFLEKNTRNNTTQKIVVNGERYSPGLPDFTGAPNTGCIHIPQNRLAPSPYGLRKNSDSRSYIICLNPTREKSLDARTSTRIDRSGLLCSSNGRVPLLGHFRELESASQRKKRNWGHGWQYPNSSAPSRLFASTGLYLLGRMPPSRGNQLGKTFRKISRREASGIDGHASTY